MTSIPAWKNYEEQARDFFSSLGLNSHVGLSVEGVRAVHAIDVYVTFSRFGVQHRWLVECKLWQTPVPKEKVLAFQAIVQDIGADKGFLLSEAGFQAGALRAATATNIVLSSLETLKIEADEELVALSLESRLRAFDEALRKLRELTWRQECGKGNRRGDFMGVVPNGYYELTGRASIIEQSLREARRGVFPVLLDLDDLDHPRRAENVGDLLAYADGLLARLEGYRILHKDFKPTQNVS